MNKRLKIALKAVGILVLVLIVAYSALGIVVYSSVGRFPVKPLPKALINQLVWPTIGYPALVAPGAALEAEVELGDRGPPPSSWTAVLMPVREALKPLTYRIRAAKAWLARSTRWPAGTAHARTVWHVRFDLPADTVPELYDLSVEWTSDSGEGLEADGQPHALSVTDLDPESFRFVTLSDVHVHEPDVSAPKMPRSDKGISPDGTPVFFERAIDQVNLIRPDFAVILGDNVLAQRYAGEYKPEFEKFYKALRRFEVPVFLLPGNHDCYVNEVDGARVWERSLGPLHYSFDVGPAHFTAMNTNDWPASDRMMMEKLGLVVYPRKWQGQVQGAQNEKDPKTHTGQLAWARDDLRANQGSSLRVMLIHHDPYIYGGKGTPFRNERFYGIYSLGGDGEGKVALRELASRFDVGLSLAGHMHRDYVARVPDDDGGQTTFATQTAVSFDEGGESGSYPGYRLIGVSGGRVSGLTYLDGRSSIPLYDGSVPGGLTDLDVLERQALQARESPGGGWSLASYLGEPIVLRGLIQVTAAGVAGVSGGEIYRSVPVPGDPSRVVVYVRTAMEKGVPGASASEAGTPAVRQVVPLGL